MKIPQSIATLVANLSSGLTGAAASFGASAAVTWLARNVTVVATHAASHFTQSLVEGGAFGFVVNRVAVIVAQHIPSSFYNQSNLVVATAIYAPAGGITFAAAHLALRAGLIASTLSPVSAIALTITTAVVSYNAPRDKTVISTIKSPFLSAWDWATKKSDELPPKLENEPEPKVT